MSMNYICEQCGKIKIIKNCQIFVNFNINNCFKEHGVIFFTFFKNYLYNTLQKCHENK